MGHGFFAMKTLALAFVALLISTEAYASNWYVDGSRAVNQKTQTGSSAAPFGALWQAAQVAKPGDTILLLPTVTYGMLGIQTSGSSAGQITIKGAGTAPNLTRVDGGASSFGIWIDASYVTIENFDVTAGDGETAIDATSATATTPNRNIIVKGNVVHNAGRDGINIFGCDYVFVEDNTVYGNANNTANNIFSSGISILGSLDADQTTGVKTTVTGNIVYRNTNIPVCPTSGCTAANTDADGNGIIIDVNNRSYWDNNAYVGRTLIANNVIFGNGGRAIHLYRSNHVTVTSNTTYFNNQDPYEGNYLPGEIEANASGDVSVYDNIFFSDGLTGINNGVNTGHHVGISFQESTDGTGQLIAEHNLVYNPANNSELLSSSSKNTMPVTITSNTWANPLFKSAGLVESTADFQVTAGSPALGTANANESVEYDILGIARAAPKTIGAYEQPAP
jgi:parallel beta-helix repeat protein